VHADHVIARHGLSAAFIAFLVKDREETPNTLKENVETRRVFANLSALHLREILRSVSLPRP